MWSLSYRIAHAGRADDTIRALMRAMRAKDRYTAGHMRRLSRYVYPIGRRLGMREDDLAVLRAGALLHDIGKLAVDEHILRKQGPLTADECRIMRLHPIIGERIVQPLYLAAAVGPLIRHHHERWDGHGYPDGLAGAAIPLGARIVAVADAFDAMTSQRPYSQPIAAAAAAERLRAGAGVIWDSSVVAAFVDWLCPANRGAIMNFKKLIGY
jgi:cyclic di-GMP phosphodiesterase